MSSVAGTTLYFPTQNEITAYLTKHPLTRGPYLTENKVIETVAKFFANTLQTPRQVNERLRCSLGDLNKTLKLPQVALTALRFNLIVALHDCASEWTLEGDESHKLVSKL
jgi:hypothetical protein